MTHRCAKLSSFSADFIEGVNDGAPVAGRVTLGERDGLFLVRER